MTTIVVHSIGSAGGRDYSTIQAWEDACPANLVTADQVWKGECYNDSEFGAFTVSGETTDATRYVWLTCAAGQGFGGNANKNTNALRYNQANGVGVRITAAYSTPFTVAANVDCVIDGLQFYFNSTFGSGYYQPQIANNRTTVKNFIFQSDRTGNVASLRVVGSTFINGLVLLTNTGLMAFDMQGGTFIALTIVRTTDNAASGRGFSYRYTNSCTFIDCAVFGFTSPIFNVGTVGAGTGWNATDQAAFGAGTNNQTSLTYANQFNNTTNAAANFSIKAGNSLALNGQRQQTYTNDLDIIGNPRSTTAPTIGAWEGASAANYRMLLIE